MEVVTSIRQRRSTRAFLPEPVPERVVREVLEDAVWAPSWANTQDWTVYAVTGDGLERLKTEMARDAAASVPQRAEVAMPDRDWPDDVLARSMFARATGLKRVVGAVRRRIASRPAPPSDIVYGAPCVLIVALRDSGYGEYAALDAGLFVQTLCLSAHAKGLGTCILAQVVKRPEALRRVLPGLDGKRLLVGVALGFADNGAATNRTRRRRVPVDELVTWVKE